MSVRLASLPLAFAARGLAPSLRPVTRPTQPPLLSDLKAADTSVPPTDTVGAAAAVIRTNASPPLTSSGRDDNTSMPSDWANAPDAPSARKPLTNPPRTATDAAKIALFMPRSSRFSIDLLAQE